MKETKARVPRKSPGSHQAARRPAPQLLLGPPACQKPVATWRSPQGHHGHAPIHIPSWWLQAPHTRTDVSPRGPLM